MSNYRVASRYAKSLIELAHERGVLEEVKDDILLFTKTVDESHDLALLLKSPLINHAKKSVILKAIFGGKTQEMTAMFFDIICSKSREAILETVGHAFIDQYNVMKSVQRASIVSASPLTAELKTKIESIVNTIAGTKEVELAASVDESLIGGYVLTIGDRQIDDSVKGRLDGMKEALM